MCKGKKYYFKVLVIISVTVQLFWIITIFIHNKNYLFDTGLQENPDAHHYYNLGKNIFTYHTFSRSAHPPLLLSPIRTPGYPALIATAFFVSKHFSVLLTIFFQALLYIIGTLLLYKVVKCIFDEKIAFIASLLMCADLVSHTMIYQIMSETLYTTFLILVMFIILKYLEKRTLIYSILLGLLLAFLVLIKPAGLYLVILIPVFLIIENYRNKKNILFSLLCAGILVVCILPWIYRNYLLFNVKKISMADCSILVYHAGGSIYQEAYGLSYNDAWEKISEDFKLPTNSDLMNFKISYSDYQHYNNKYRNAIITIIKKHPKEFILSTIKSPIKAMLSHATGAQAYMLNKEYTNIGTMNLLRFKIKDIFKRGKKNALVINLFLIYEVIFNVLILILFFCGTVSLFYIVFFKKSRIIKTSHFYLLMMFILYLFLISSTIGATTYYRYRVPNMPFVFIIAGFAFNFYIMPVLKRLFNFSK